MHCRPGGGMAEAQFSGVQVQPRRHLKGLLVCIKVVAENGMTEGGEVHAQLVGAPGQRRELQAGGLFPAVQNFITGLARFPLS